MAATANPYTGPYLWPNSTDYYIHYHQKNIGKAMHGSDLNTGNITQRWKNQKDKIWQLSTAQYMQLFRNINRPKKGQKDIQLLQEVFSGNESELFTKMDKEIAEKIQKSVNDNGSLLELYLNQNNLFNNSNQYFQSILNGKSAEALRNFDNLLGTLADCCKLIGEEGGALATALLDTSSSLSTSSSSYDYGVELTKQLDKFKHDNEGKIISGSSIEHAWHSLEILSNNLRKGTTTSKSSLTIDSFKNVLDHIFGNGLAEAIAAMPDVISDMNLKEVEMITTGSNRVAKNIYDVKLEETVDMLENLVAGKTDFVGHNLNFHLDSIANINGGNIQLNLGFSNKLYRSNRFPGINNGKIKMQYNLGGGGNFTDSIDALFGFFEHAQSIYDKYLAYNIIAHNKTMASAYEQLQELVLINQFLSLASTRDYYTDFSSYIIANGTVVSIWQILIMMEKDFYGKSGSKNNQAITLSVSGKKGLDGIVAIDNAGGANGNQGLRVHKVNAQIRNMNITAYLHLDKYLNAMKK